jgi:hypothetical protein
MEQNDDLKNDIHEIKNDICIIKNNIDTLSLAFNKHIQEHLITSSGTQSDSANTSESDNTVQDNVSNINKLNSSLDINDAISEYKELGKEILKDNLIDFAFIENNDNNKLFLQILYNSNKNMSSCYQRDFLKFCDCAISLVEEVIKFFLVKKFNDIEDEDENDNLLQACDLLEKKYKEKSFSFPELYISTETYNKYYMYEPDNFCYISNKIQYLSLDKLKEAKISFKLELVFVTLYGNNFYITNTRPANINLPTSSKALKRPPVKLPTSIESLNIKFYYLIDNARKFRNIIEHNQNNREEQEKQIELLLLKTPKLRNTYNNYDGIVEAVSWFIRQLYIAIIK